MSTTPYIKLDWNWADSPGAVLLRQRHGTKALLGWIQLMILMAEFGGSFDLNDDLQMATAVRRMRKSEQKVRETVSWCAECGLIDQEYFNTFARASSARAMRDARARENRIRYARERVEDGLCIEDARSEVIVNCG